MGFGWGLRAGLFKRLDLPNIWCMLGVNINEKLLSEKVGMKTSTPGPNPDTPHSELFAGMDNSDGIEGMVMEKVGVAHPGVGQLLPRRRQKAATTAAPAAATATAMSTPATAAATFAAAPAISAAVPTAPAATASSSNASTAEADRTEQQMLSGVPYHVSLSAQCSKEQKGLQVCVRVQPLPLGHVLLIQ